MHAVQETWVQEDPLEKEMGTHSSILIWRISWTEEPGRLESMGLLRLGHPAFAFQSPIMKRTSFWGVLVLKGLVGLHRTVQLQLLQHYWLGHIVSLLGNPIPPAGPWPLVAALPPQLQDSPIGVKYIDR